jgi:hypothetical protein
MMLSNELRDRAEIYIRARRAQELDHTDPELDYARTEAHDSFMIQLDIENIYYEDRQHAARIAQAIVDGREVIVLQRPRKAGNLLTAKQVASMLGVADSRVYALLKQPCPACAGAGGDCQRCRGTGHKLPHQEMRLHSGKGAIKLIYPWSVGLPDVRDRWSGHGGRPVELPENVRLRREGTKFAVLVDGRDVGSVYRRGKRRRSWLWESGDVVSARSFRNRKDAIKALVNYPA